MNDHSEDERRIRDLRLKIIGLGELSQRKSYYSQLQERIAELEHANRALEESERKYRTLVENVNIGIFQTSPARNQPIVHANQAMARIFGYSDISELLTVTPEALYHDPKDREDLLTLLRSRGEVKDRKVTMKRREGTEIVCSLTFTAAPGPAGEIQWINGAITDITEQEKVEGALRESEKKFRMIAENTTDIIWTMDFKLGFTYISPSVAQIRGYTVDEAMNQSIDQVLTPSSLETALKLLEEERVRKKMQGKDRDPVLKVELDESCKDGKVIKTENTLSLLLDDSLKPVGILGVTRDITSRKHFEDSLKEVNSHLSMAMDLAQLVYWEYDLSSKVYLLNDRFYSLYGTDAMREGGYSMPQEIYYQDFVHPDDIAFVLEMAAKTPDYNRNRLHFSHRIIRRDGEVRVIKVYPSQIKDDEGNVIKVYGVNQDVTEQKRAEDELRESEERFRTLSEASFEGIVIHVNGLIVDMNKAALEQMRYSRDEVIGRSILDFFAPESIEAVREVVRLPSVEPYEAHLVRKDGEIRTVQVKARSMDFNGRQARVATIMDVTDQVIARKQIEELVQKKEEERYRLKTILDILPVGVRVIGVNGETGLTNNRLDEIFNGLQHVDFLGDSIPQESGWADSNRTVLPEDIPLHEAITTGVSVIGKVFDFQRFDGTNGTFMASASRSRTTRGSSSGVWRPLRTLLNCMKLRENLPDPTLTCSSSPMSPHMTYKSRCG